MKYFLLVATIMLLAWSPFGVAQTYYLKSGSQLKGTWLGASETALKLRLEDGSILSLPLTDLDHIDFVANQSVNEDRINTEPKSSQNPNSKSETPVSVGQLKPEKPFSTPQNTFEHWRKAALSGDIQDMVDCYAKPYQATIKKDLKAIPKKRREEMKTAALQTSFYPNDPVYAGDRAAMEVTWKKGTDVSVQTLNFMLEGETWKLIQ